MEKLEFEIDGINFIIKNHLLYIEQDKKEFVLMLGFTLNKTILIKYNQDFKKELSERLKRYIESEEIKKVDWNIRDKRIEKLSSIDFGCDFKTGTCKAYRESKGTQNCCHRCAISKGFLDRFHPEGVEEYESKFHGLLGFWRPEKGCILSKRFRSSICLSYNCFLKGNKSFLRFLSDYPLKEKYLI